MRGRRHLDEDLRGLRQLVDGQQLGVDAVHLFTREGEEAEHRWAPDERRGVFSVAMTFTAAAVGIAREEGLLDLDDRLLDHLPALRRVAADGVEETTLRHLLTMRAGNGYSWPHLGRTHHDPAADLLARPLLADPGSFFHHGPAAAYLLGRVVAARSGDDLRDYLVPRLFAPLGISAPSWRRCRLGHPLGFTGLSLRTAEVARFGRMLLDAGRAGGCQLVPSTFVGAMATANVLTDGYGDDPSSRAYGWYVWPCGRGGAWRMEGEYGQLCVVLPDQSLCVTVTAADEGCTTDILRGVLTVLDPDQESKAA